MVILNTIQQDIIEIGLLGFNIPIFSITLFIERQHTVKTVFNVISEPLSILKILICIAQHILAISIFRQKIRKAQQYQSYKNIYG